jgi:hypothetical protein
LDPAHGFIDILDADFDGVDDDRLYRVLNQAPSASRDHSGGLGAARAQLV